MRYQSYPIFNVAEVQSALTNLNQAVRTSAQISAPGVNAPTRDQWLASVCNVLSKLETLAVHAATHYQRCGQQSDQFEPIRARAHVLLDGATRAMRNGDLSFWATLEAEVQPLRAAWHEALEQVGYKPPARHQPVKMSPAALAHANELERLRNY